MLEEIMLFTDGLESIYLTVNKNNTNTISAYIKLGFEIVDSIITDIGSNFVMDDYIMEKKPIKTI